MRRFLLSLLFSCELDIMLLIQLQLPFLFKTFQSTLLFSSALAVILFLLVFACSAAVLRITKRDSVEAS